MDITRKNYETYFIDYLDGTLEESQIDQFLDFLSKNPDLKEELKLFKQIKLDPNTVSFAKKNRLFKSYLDVEENFDQAAVAMLEGNLSASEKEELENYLKSHPKKREDFQLFKKTKLLPDPAVKYRLKNKLYHRQKNKTIIMWTTRTAAAAVLILFIYLLTDRNFVPEIDHSPVAETFKKEQQKEPDSDKIKKLENTDNKYINTNTTLLTSNSENKKSKQKPTKDVSRTIVKEPKTDDAGVALRSNVVVLEKMPLITASLDIKTPNATLAPVTVTIIFKDASAKMEEEHLLADIVREKTGLNKLSLDKVAKAGLNVISDLSGEKLAYKTNTSGKVTEINYESRLLAFSIPVKNKK
ncbi:MAG: hypothetical protein CSA36_04000 [Draconibacterium sp.]|nr:MAG: hypothetical protein CSA36_04000 [Draconibacterium sp.]